MEKEQIINYIIKDYERAYACACGSHDEFVSSLNNSITILVYNYLLLQSGYTALGNHPLYLVPNDKKELLNLFKMFYLQNFEWAKGLTGLEASYIIEIKDELEIYKAACDELNNELNAKKEMKRI